MLDLEKIYDKVFYPTNDEIYEHIKYVHNILEKNEIKHWLMYGTLLGCIREKNVIAHDYDFDFGVMLNDVDKILNINQENKDYEFKKVTGTYYSKKSKFTIPETIWKINIGVFYQEIKVGDLYVYYACEDGYTRRYEPEKKLLFWPNSVFPSAFVDTLDCGYIRDLKLPIPNHPVLLLEYFYGPMWITPIKSRSQVGGTGHPDYDYYGGYLYSNLNNLTNNLINAFEKEGKNVKIGKPNLKEEDVDYLFPLEQFKWISENEGINFKYKK